MSTTDNISKIVADAKESTKNLWPDEGRHVWRLIDQIETALDAANLAQPGGLLGALVALDSDLHGTEATRLRDGIKEALDDMHNLANKEGPSQDYNQGYYDAVHSIDSALCALLDGEAKG